MILLEDSNISLDEVLDVLKKEKKMIDIENYNNENIFAKILRMKFHLKRFMKMNMFMRLMILNRKLKYMF